MEGVGFGGSECEVVRLGGVGVCLMWGYEGAELVCIFPMCGREVSSSLRKSIFILRYLGVSWTILPIIILVAYRGVWYILECGDL